MTAFIGIAHVEIRRDAGILVKPPHDRRD